jgi:hypothetical protein
MLEGQSLVPTTEDIYFLTGLSRRGEPVNFQTFPAGPSKVSELIDEYCEAGTDHRGSSVPVSRITSLALQTILLLIGRITGSAAVHQASCAQMNCAIQCMNAQIFDWSTTLLECMKRQLTDCRQRTHRNFGFGTILCSFFFERVLCFSPRLTVRGHLATFPAVCRWAVLLPTGWWKDRGGLQRRLFCLAVMTDPGYRGLPICGDRLLQRSRDTSAS